MNVFSGTGLPGLSRTNGRKMVVVVVVVSVGRFLLERGIVVRNKNKNNINNFVLL